MGPVAEQMVRVKGEGAWKAHSNAVPLGELKQRSLKTGAKE